MIALLDTITPGALAGTPIADAYAGYVGGHWADYPSIVQRYPNHHHTSIAVFPDEVADFCDCEQGDFTPPQVAPWLLAMHKKGIWRPGFYCNASTLPAVLPAVQRVLPRVLYRVWVASWDGRRTLPSGWDGHQYADHGPHGENYDMSVVADDFFPAHRPPPAPYRAKLTAYVEVDPAHRAWRLYDHTTVSNV